MYCMNHFFLEEDREPSRKLLEEHYNLYQEFYDSNEPALRTMAEALLYSEQYLKATRRLDHTPDQNLIIQESFKVLELAKIPANIESQDQLTHWDTIKLKYEKVSLVAFFLFKYHSPSTFSGCFAEF